MTEDGEMYECFHCCQKAVIWDSDFDFEDLGLEGQGIVHMCVLIAERRSSTGYRYQMRMKKMAETVEWYKDIRRCPICNSPCQKKGSVYLEFRCQNRKCGAIVRFPSESKLTAEEQIDRFNSRFTDV